MEEDSDEIVLGELDPFASPSLPDLMNSPSDSLDSAGTDDDERDSVCFVEIEERPVGLSFYDSQSSKKGEGGEGETTLD